MVYNDPSFIVNGEAKRYPTSVFKHRCGSIRQWICQPLQVDRLKGLGDTTVGETCDMGFARSFPGGYRTDVAVERYAEPLIVEGHALPARQVAGRNNRLK